MSVSTSRKRRVETAADQPPAAPPLVDEIPAELKALPRWVAWRWWRKHGRWTKVPLNPRDLRPAM